MRWNRLVGTDGRLCSSVDGTDSGVGERRCQCRVKRCFDPHFKDSNGAVDSDQSPRRLTACRGHFDGDSIVVEWRGDRRRELGLWRLTGPEMS